MVTWKNGADRALPHSILLPHALEPDRTPDRPDDFAGIRRGSDRLDRDSLRRVKRRDGNAYYMARVLPYWTGNGKIEGAILTFIDVTSLAQAQAQQRVLTAEIDRRDRARDAE